MATSLHKFVVLNIFSSLCVVLLPSVMGEGVLDGENCRVLSGKFKGLCFDEDGCNANCRNNEGADSGTCYDYGRCWCEYRHCGTTCRKPSGLWKGLCVRGDHCHDQCQAKEGATGGYCNWLACWCIYDC